MNFADDLRNKLVSLPATGKLGITLTADALAVGLAYFMAGLFIWPTYHFEHALQASRLLPAVAFPMAVLAALGGYRSVVRFIGFNFGLRLAVAASCGALLNYDYLVALGDDERSVRVSAMYAILSFLMIMSQRLLAGHYLRPSTRNERRDTTLIYGAGDAGYQLAASLLHSGRYNVVGFIDDNPKMHNRLIDGLRIYDADQLPDLCARKSVGKILLAIPSVTHARRREILQKLEPLAVETFVLPGLDELADGKRSFEDLRPVRVEDLLGREPVAPIESLLDGVIHGHCVMVTGAGGSIGSELCRLAVKRGARRLVMFEHSEFALYTIEQELRKESATAPCELVPVLGSVTDRNALKAVFDLHAVETVYHAAAYKHVPLVEENIAAAVQNNIIGTWVTAETALTAGVRNFVLVSTDKAVRPTSVMGATKRVCELIVQGLTELYPRASLSIVRFGNVLASSGSVVPAFLRQIQENEPVTVTHPQVTRYFMTVQEAAQLVVQAGAMGCHGEVFVLDMGEPVRICDLAEKMIRLSGKQLRTADNPEGDIEIQYTGLRPGEKLYEELLMADNPEDTRHPRIFRAQEAKLAWPQLKQSLSAMAQALETREQLKLLSELHQLVSNFVHVALPLSSDTNPNTICTNTGARPYAVAARATAERTSTVL